MIHTRVILYLITLFMLMGVAYSCIQYDDSALWKRIQDHEDRLMQLERMSEALNSNIESLSYIVQSVKNNNPVGDIHSIFEDGKEIGYTITFSDGNKCNVYTNALSVASIPAIGIGENYGVYYWTLNGRWLTDSNNDRIAVTEIPLQLRFLDDRWELSVDGGNNWKALISSLGESQIWLSHVWEDNDNLFFKFGALTFVLPKYSTREVISDKSLCVLSIGSSFGVNVFVQFPALASSIGIEIIGTNMYKGSCSLHEIAELCRNDEQFEGSATYSFKTRSWKPSSRRVSEVLRSQDWDIIILQRPAPGQVGGSDQWTVDMAKDLDYILKYIQFGASGHPKVMFCSSFSRSVGQLGSREKQFASVELIMQTSKQISDSFGLDIIPAAVAVHNARITSLSRVQTYNSMGYDIPDLTGEGNHLDTGVGSYILGCLLFEQICGKRYDLSILNVPYIPTIEDVRGNAGGFNDSNYTQITAEQAHIAKYAAMSAIKSPWEVNYLLSELYP